MIHVFKDPVDGEVAVWLDPGAEHKVGVCLGCEETEAKALAEARKTLQEALGAVIKREQNVGIT